MFSFEAPLENRAVLAATLLAWEPLLAKTFRYGHLNATARADITKSVNKFYFGKESTPTINVNIQVLMNVS